MTSWRLTPQAEESLAEIAEWTARQFGRRQALAYCDALIERISGLATGALPHARPCAALFKGELDEQALKGLTYCREGMHYLVFRQEAETLTVLDILYASMDLERHVSELAGAKRR